MRREELGIQQEEMDDHGGPSSTTMSRVERGIAPPSAKTLRKLDAGLQWQQGSAARALEGGDPTPLMPGTVTDKPLRPIGQTTQSYPTADVASLVDSLNSIAGATEAMRPMLDDPNASEELRGHLLLANEKFANTMMLAVVACELLGEQLASEDITDVANLGAFASRLDGYADQLVALRDAVRRMDRALYRGEVTTKEEKDAVPSDATKEPPAPPAPPEAVENQKSNVTRLPHWGGGDNPPLPPRLTDPGVAASRGEKQSDFDQPDDEVDEENDPE